ncbi:TIGR00341 family protein [Halomicrococcus gelatinilyticus]|uniref:TIGR00341 family protein n=1 Tax=Halomicrococcus gelatinilyticus TaxID=1702103 RepID=UPI002E0D9094
MRLVQVMVPEGERDSVLAVLDGEGIDYALVEETGRGEFEALVSFPVPPSGVEPIMDNLRAAGVEKDTYAIVLPTETVVSRRIERLEERYSGLRISRDELLARAEELAPATSTYVAFLVLSTVIATTGLLLDSAATIIGAMVVAPLMGPAISASVGTVVDDARLYRRGVIFQVGGLLLAIAVAALLAALIRGTVLVPPDLAIRQVSQIAERTSPNFLSLFLALGSGVAAAVSIFRGAGSALVGVAIAVALVPPAATAGIGLAWLDFAVASTATVLVVVNLLGINLSALLVFWLAGYRPPEAEAADRAWAAVRSRAVGIVVAILVLSVVLAAVTFASFQVADFDARATDEVEATIMGPEYARLDFVSASVEYTPGDVLLDRPPSVDVVVGRPAGYEQPPDVATTLERRIAVTTGEDAVVRVVFVEEQRSDQ